MRWGLWMGRWGLGSEDAYHGRRDAKFLRRWYDDGAWDGLDGVVTDTTAVTAWRVIACISERMLDTCRYEPRHWLHAKRLALLEILLYTISAIHTSITSMIFRTKSRISALFVIPISHAPEEVLEGGVGDVRVPLAGCVHASIPRPQPGARWTICFIMLNVYSAEDANLRVLPCFVLV